MKLTGKAVCAAIMCAVSVPAASTNLYAVLEPDGNSYRLRDTFAEADPNRINDVLGLRQADWTMSASTLAPAFPTARFECVIDTSKNVDSCKEYQDLEARFVYLNTFKSGYGDTAAERKAKEKPASEQVKSAVAMTMAGMIAAPFLVAASPLLLVGAARKTESKKWVEFNHDRFNEAVDDAVKKAGFATRTDWTNTVVAINDIVARLEKAEDGAYKGANERATQERNAIVPYAQLGIATKAYDLGIKRFAFPPIPIRIAAIDEAMILNQISQHYATQVGEYSALVKSEIDNLKPAYEARRAERAEEERQVTIRAAEEERQAKVRAVEAERQAKIRAAEEERQAKIEEKMRKERERKQLAALALFRGKLEIGVDTHCGPIIEIKGPMIKVAVIAQLSGYGSEAWLKRNEIFTPEYGCHNMNGRLFPLSAPG